MPDLRSMTDDERFESAMAATTFERRNRPRHLLLLPLLLFLAAAIAIVVALYTHESSRIRVGQEQARYKRLVQGVADLRDLQGAQSQASGGAYEPVPNLLSRMEGFARDAGLTRSLSIPTTRVDRSEGARRLSYTYSNITDPSISALLAWVEISCEQVPGMFVNSITLKPASTQGWTVDVTFARWERESS
ncbi:MAG: hypothetical protein KF757_01430 [Phycisphaeraceae bacterium]|nr:hypothetical protein [Phycisphaeraceae bacterium]MCW5761871.1 hypothetical protein [Phycisphaeraceae bacterium]